MKHKLVRRVIASVMTALLVVGLIPMTFTGGGVKVSAEELTYVIDGASIEELKGDLTEYTQYGTSNFFTLLCSSNKKIGIKSLNCLNAAITNETDKQFKNTVRLGGGGLGLDGGKVVNAIKFTVSSSAKVTIYASGKKSDAKSLIINKATTLDDSEKGTTVYTSEAFDWSTVKKLEYNITEAGTYYVGFAGNGGVIPYISVTTSGEVAEKTDWSKVEAPEITSAVQNDNGEIEVSFKMTIGNDGADSVKVTMTDAEGNTENKSSTTTDGTVKFTPKASGTYTFSIAASRTECEDKVGAETNTVEFVLPLGTPIIKSATSVGDGKVSVVWDAVKEADSYNVYVDGVLSGTTDKTEYTVEGLTVGNQYAFTVAAVRGAEVGKQSEASSVKVTSDKQTVWGFATYGTSTSTEKNTAKKNADGSVTVVSAGGKGKIVPATTDGIAFYYTQVPTEYNFTLRAKVHVDTWVMDGGQSGFGLVATDRIAESGNTDNIWNNSYMLTAGPKIEYYWDAEKNEIASSGVKYSMKGGIGAIAKTGVTKENLDLFMKNDTATINACFSSVTSIFDTTAPSLGKDAGTYNVIGNESSGKTTNIAGYTDFVFEIQKNNTGYFLTYYDADGNIIAQSKNYDPDALSKIESENVYVGFFTSRNATATFSDIEFKTILASEDAASEDRPITYVTPMVTITSAGVANTENYTFSFIANVDGTADITLAGQTVAAGLAVKANQVVNVPVTITGTSDIAMVFAPDPDYVPGEYMKLANTDKINSVLTVSRNIAFADLTEIYVSPDGTASGAGTKESPVDVYTAVKYVQPGQTIVIMEGTYLLNSTIRVERGVDGTADKPIRMIADPNSSTRPVFDFQSKCAGMVLGGNYWYFKGFDCIHSQDMQKGIQVSGSNITLDRVDAYHNGNTGIQISRLFSTDTREYWPSDNLILNCTSYGNSDASYQDADGFAAKLTVGEGNVFDGCVAHHNADDGWDLYAKAETGSIGMVTIKNCVAYANGYLEDGTDAGNGNGFKMGGESLSGHHKLINSYAFFNKAKGIDSNSCPDIQVESSTSYNNESYNVAFYTNNAANTDFAATGILSFKDSTTKSGLNTAEQFKTKGTQDDSKFKTDSNYYWNGSKSLNNSGTEADASWFKSLEFTGFTRNADGSINLNGFLESTDIVPAGVGARPVGKSDIDEPSDTDKPNDTENPSEPSAPSGTSVGGSVISSSDSTVTVTSGKDGYVSNEVFASLIKDKKTLVVNVTDDNGNVAATFTIDGSTFNSVPDSLFRLSVKFNAHQAAADKAKEILSVEDKDILVCTFDSVGYLNGKVSITVKADGFEAGTQLKLYYYNEELNTVMDKNQTVTVGEDGKVTFTVDHFSSYVLVNAGKALITAPSTGFGSSAAALMGIMLLAGGTAGACLFKKRK